MVTDVASQGAVSDALVAARAYVQKLIDQAGYASMDDLREGAFEDEYRMAKALHAMGLVSFCSQDGDPESQDGRREAGARQADAQNLGGMLKAPLQASPEVVAGALFDFVGFLTTMDDAVHVGAEHAVYGIFGAFTEWARSRGLALDGAAVTDWRDLTFPESGVERCRSKFSEPRRFDGEPRT